MPTLSQTLSPLSPEQLDKLTPGELEEYERHLEALYWSRGKESFLDFVGRVEVPGAPVNDSGDEFFPERVTPAAHHKLIIRTVQDLADDRMPGVSGIMVFMAPGSAKSTYLSVLGASWLLGRKPGTNVIGASYGQDLANRVGRRVRQIVRSPEYARVMGCTITGDNQAVDSWSLTNGSDYRAAGFGAAVTGFRADWALIDDPIKNREEADSQIIRDKVFASYEDDISTRLKPGGKIIMVLTRWHENDPAGRVLGEKWKGQSGLWRGTDGRLWFVLNLPLKAEHKDDPLGRAHGVLMWPEWFRQEDADRLEAQAKKGGSYARTWSSLYQQRPAPSEGAILTRSYWQKWEKKLPECSQIYLCYDTAFEEDEDADYSAMTAWGVFEGTSKKTGGYEYNHNHVLLLGSWQERCSAVDLLDKVKFHAKLFTPDRILVEKRASGIQLIQEMQRMRLPVKAWLPPGKPGAKGKIPRAHAVAAILEQGAVWYVPGPRTEMVIEQCAAFPYGKNDDLCFVAGTLIAVRRGILPIEQVRIGDEALTPQGWRRVSAAGFTGVRPVVARGGLTGTGKHPVFTLENGYVPLESIKIKAGVTVSRAGLWSLIKTIRLRPWNFAASHTGAWEARGSTISAATDACPNAKKPRGFMWRSGNITLADVCRRGMRYIIRTAILLIAALRIWSAYRSLSIEACQRSTLIWLNNWLTSIECGRLPRSGTHLVRDASGTGKTLSSPVHSSPGLSVCLLSRSLHGPALSAAVYSNELISGSSRVPQNATTPSDGERRAANRAGLFKVRASVASVGKALFTRMRDKWCVQRDATTPAKEPSVMPVYNLTVEGSHCYYANGVLVHNCDTVTMSLSFFRAKYIMRTADDELDKSELEEAMLTHSDKRRIKRALYSGPIVRNADDEPDEISRMTNDTRRRLYGA